MNRAVTVIGAGRWGRNLVRNLAELGALHGVADAAAHVRASLELEASVRVFDDHAAAIASSAPAVAIATPSGTHFDIARAALCAGKDVFVEKPMTMTAGDAQALVALARAERRVLMVGHLLLFQPAVVWLREAIASGMVGQVLRLHHERLQFGRARVAENALWSLGVHDVAVALFLVGRVPTRVDALGHGAVRSDVAEEVHLELGFDGGVQAHVHASWRWPQRRRCLTVVGADAMLVYDELAQTVVLHRKRIARAALEPRCDDDLRCLDDGSEVVFRGSGEPVRLELEHFLSCVRERSVPRADGEGGLAVVEVLERAERAMARRGLRA